MKVQPALVPLRRWDPERIGPYTLLGRLGEGAMGQVYLGRSTAGRLVAVKTIKIEFAEEPGFRTRFAHEVAAARRVSGVFTAAVVAADPEAEVPWLATAYIPAPSLNHLVLRCGSLSVPAIRWLAAGCAEALESIHSVGLVHRDLKPSNVLVSPDGPRVIDFGVARAAERIQLTVTRGAVGTPAYMAPEQARDTRQSSMASDVFSLGATLVFAATGHPPYRGETVMDVLVRLATEPPDLTGLPAELLGFVSSCLERSPRKRATSAALLTELGPLVCELSEHSAHPHYLTDSALAMIAEYQRGPSPNAQAHAADEVAEDATFGSYSALPSSRPLPAPRWPFRRWPFRRWPFGRRPFRRHRGQGLRSPPSARAARRRTLTLAAVGTATAALVAGGMLLGASLKAGIRPTASPVPVGPGIPPPGMPPAILPTGRSSTPELRLNQTSGDGNTGYVIHGSGFAPLTRITVTLAHHGVSPVRLVVDDAGTFNYAINQGHEFFAGPIPAGSYQVVVTGVGGRHASARFTVRPPGSGGTPPAGGGTPPAGGGTPPAVRA